MTEKLIEAKIKRGFHLRNVFCEHLLGPEGYPDLTGIAFGKAFHIETKAGRFKFQPTQIPYYKKNILRMGPVFILTYVNLPIKEYILVLLEPVEGMTVEYIIERQFQMKFTKAEEVCDKILEVMRNATNV